MLCSQVLDKNKKGYLGSEELAKYMTQEGRRSFHYSLWQMTDEIIWLKVNCVCTKCCVMIPLFPLNSPFTFVSISVQFVFPVTLTVLCLYKMQVSHLARRRWMRCWRLWPTRITTTSITKISLANWPLIPKCRVGQQYELVKVFQPSM